MRRYTLLVLALFGLCCSAFAVEFEGLGIINSVNWAAKFNDLLGYKYESHGCLHFSPSDIYLLAKTVPKGVPLRIKKYKLKKDDPPFTVADVPCFADKIKFQDDIKRHARLFKSSKTEIVVYPSLNLLFIMINNTPYARVDVLAGPPSNMLIPFVVEKGKPIVWDFMLTTPTDPGNYIVLGATSHYLSSNYYKNTIVPFGAWIMKRNAVWSYQKEDKWYKLPKHITSDIELPTSKQKYNYYDVSVNKNGDLIALRYAGHDFGKYVLLWSRDGKNRYPEMGYAAGELLYEQVILVKDLVHILTVPGKDDLDSCVSKNKSFQFYKGLYDLIGSKGKTSPDDVDPVMLSYWRLYNGFNLTGKDHQLMDPRVIKAFKEFSENRLPRGQKARWQALGFNYYLKMNSEIIYKQAGWYKELKDNWKFWKDLRTKLRADFNTMGIYALPNRQNLVEEWLDQRLEFKKAAAPKQAKYLSDLSFSSFFKPDEKASVFDARERKVMEEIINKAISGEVKGLHLYSVDALNNYNFGVLLNNILGDLYKSHGCMHTSPRNIEFLYELLPIGTRITVYDYSKKVSKEAIAKVPYLADLVNFNDDLDDLKKIFSTAEAEVAVYPYFGTWLIYLDKKPYARMDVRGGPQAKMYLVQGRDKNGKPIFEDHLAYPTTPGVYYIFKKHKDYLSNIYRNTTIIPMGATISREGESWYFRDKEGKKRKVALEIQNDLSLSTDERVNSYYDPVKNISEEVVAVRWGSHPFGTYAIQTSRDKRNPHPELIHSSGDLMMEERQLINDLIKVLSAPFDDLDKCVKYSRNFDLYRSCYDFVNDPSREDLIQTRERAAYKLYFGMPLGSQEAASLPSDVLIANKVLKKKKLTKVEIKVLTNEGIAYYRSGKLKINMQKILGLQFDTYQYVVTIQKYANHYKVLKDNWEELTELRKALLKDFNTFVIKDPTLLHNFTRELMLRRTNLERLSQQKAIEILKEMLKKEKRAGPVPKRLRAWYRAG